MMNYIYKLYHKVPLIRFLKKKLGIKTPVIKVNIRWGIDPVIKFVYFAILPAAVRAQSRGIENSMLRLSLKLLAYKKGENQDNVIIDVGANWGFLSLVYANTVAYPNGKVFAFEPHPNIYKWLGKSIVENKLSNQINLTHAAVGDVDARVSIALFQGASNILMSSKDKIEVKQVALDNFLSTVERVDLIKIDVDGYEYNVLQGAKNIIDRFRPICIVETNSDARIIDFFKEKGYYLYDLKMEELGAEIPGNLVCLNFKYKN